MKRNNDIREAINKAHLYYWEVAEKLEITDVTFCKWLRYDLSESRRCKILEAIKSAEKDRLEMS